VENENKVEEKFCPLFTIAVAICFKSKIPQICLENDCAWWIVNRAGIKECVITQMARGCEDVK
jgi:hypothetical protein